MFKKISIILIVLLFFIYTYTFAWSLKKTLKDVGEIGQGVIDNARGKESEANKKLDKLIQKPIDAVRKPVKKVDDKISDVWNEWREDNIDPIGDYIAIAYKYLKAGKKGPPDGFSVQSKNFIQHPDIQVTLNNELLNKLFDQFLGEQIPLDKDEPNNGDYFYFDEIGITNDATRRVIVMKISRGRLKFKFVTRNTLKVKSATMEFLPKIRKLNGKLYLDLIARLTHLNIDNLLPIVERGIAHGINDHFKSKDAFFNIDLTGTFGKSITMPTVDKDIIELCLSESSVFIEGNSIIYQAKLSSRKK